LAACGVAVEEAGEVVDIEGGGGGGVVAVGVGVGRGVAVEEAGEVVDIEERSAGRAVAVGVAGVGVADEAQGAVALLIQASADADKKLLARGGWEEDEALVVAGDDLIGAGGAGVVDGEARVETCLGDGDGGAAAAGRGVPEPDI
jgi:hypothetical protein